MDQKSQGTEQPRELTLVGQHLQLNPAFFVGLVGPAGMLAFSGVQLWIYGLSPMGMVFLGTIAFLILTAAILIPVITFLTHRPTLVVDHTYLRVHSSRNRRMQIPWANVTAVRTSRSWQRRSLIFDIDPDYWRLVGGRPWNPYATVGQISIDPAGLTLEEAMDEVEARIPAAYATSVSIVPDRTRTWHPAAVGAFTMVCGLLIAAMPTLALTFRVSPPTKPASIPGSVCKLVSSTTLAILVPNHNRMTSDPPIDTTSEVTARCRIENPRDLPTSSSLEITITRYAPFVRDTALTYAQREFSRYRNRQSKRLLSDSDDAVVDVVGLGEEAIALVNPTNSRLTVRHESDIVEISFGARSTTRNRTLHTAVFVAREMLGRLG